MLIAITLVGVGFVAGLATWGRSRDRRRGIALRKIALHYRLPVEAVQEASLRALRYELVEDFTFLVRMAHPQPPNGEAPVGLSGWHHDSITGGSARRLIMSLHQLKSVLPKKGEA